MSKLKDNKTSDKINKCSVQNLDHISFSLKHQTYNKSYGLGYFTDTRESHKAYEKLFEKMCELSQIDMNIAKSWGKILGCEPIPYKKFEKSFQNIMDGIDLIAKDSTLSVFRFCQNDYRLICKTDISHPNLLYIIGYDFDYSAYPHG